MQVESEDKCCGSPSAIYYRGKNISRSVNTDKSYYLRLCLLKVMSPNEQDTAIRLGGGVGVSESLPLFMRPAELIN